MRSLKKSYLLMLPTLFGVAGLHRFYMGKVPTGILWLCTWGLGGLGTLYDALTMARQLSKADEEGSGEYNEPADYWLQLAGDLPDHRMRRRIESRYGGRGESRPREETLEHCALRLARDNGGLLSPAVLALESGAGADAAKAELDRLVDRGHAEVRIRRNGLVVYAFQEFLSPDKAADLEPF